jgi:hypothetical protein
MDVLIVDFLAYCDHCGVRSFREVRIKVSQLVELVAP